MISIYIYILIYFFLPSFGERRCGFFRTAPFYMLAPAVANITSYLSISSFSISSSLILPAVKKISFSLDTEKLHSCGGFFNRQPMGCFDPCAQNALSLQEHGMTGMLCGVLAGDVDILRQLVEHRGDVPLDDSPESMMR